MKPREHVRVGSLMSVGGLECPPCPFHVLFSHRPSCPSRSIYRPTVELKAHRSRFTAVNHARPCLHRTRELVKAISHRSLLHTDSLPHPSLPPSLPRIQAASFSTPIHSIQITPTSTDQLLHLSRPSLSLCWSMGRGGRRKIRSRKGDSVFGG